MQIVENPDFKWTSKLFGWPFGLNTVEQLHDLCY